MQDKPRTTEELRLLDKYGTGSGKSEGPSMGLAKAAMPASVASQIKLEEAQQTAVALIGIVKNRAAQKRPLVVQISGRDYLLVEAWEFLAGALGVTTRILQTIPLTSEGKSESGQPHMEKADGWRVEAAAYRNGVLLANGWSQAIKQEPSRGNLTDAQLLGLAQTRAIGRTLRHCLAWVTVMAGYSPTPAEEVE